MEENDRFLSVFVIDRIVERTSLIDQEKLAFISLLLEKKKKDEKRRYSVSMNMFVFLRERSVFYV